MRDGEVPVDEHKHEDSDTCVRKYVLLTFIFCRPKQKQLNTSYTAQKSVIYVSDALLSFFRYLCSVCKLRPHNKPNSNIHLCVLIIIDVHVHSLRTPHYQHKSTAASAPSQKSWINSNAPTNWTVTHVARVVSIIRKHSGEVQSLQWSWTRDDALRLSTHAPHLCSMGFRTSIALVIDTFYNFLNHRRKFW